MREGFVLSAFQEELESGFVVYNPDFDEVAREFFYEERELANKLAEFGIEYSVFVPDRELDIEEFKEKMKESIEDPFIYENNISRVLVKLLKDGRVSVEFSYPGSQKKYWANFELQEVQDLPLEVQKKLLDINPFVFPYIDECLVSIESVIFFESKQSIYVKFILSNKEVVYSLNDKNRELLSFIKQKFDLFYEVEESWKEFQAKERKESKVYRAVKNALRIFKKESGISDWYQYSVRFSEKIIYIFKPRLNDRGEVYYSVFKILKGNLEMGIPDKVEGLFAVSTDKFLKEWEPFLERRR